MEYIKYIKMVIIMNFYQFIKMSCLSFLFIGLSLVNVISGNKNSDSGIITIPSSSSGSSSSGSSLAALSNFPEIFLFRQKAPIECTDENCLNDKIEKNIQLSNHYDDPTYGQDYDWNKMDYNNNEVVQKRHNINSDDYQQHSSCACQTKFELIDLGYNHFPRYLVTAVCQNRIANSRKCWHGSQCKEIPYKVRVLTRRPETESIEDDRLSSSLPDSLRSMWKFKTITVTAACQCSM